MKIDKKVSDILKKLEKNGFEGYVVGGCVRDSLMGIKPHDYDITTNALPSDIKRLFSHTVDTGIKHGTVTAVIDKDNYEITTYRIDGEYKDGRHPENVFFTDKITEDLSRRDFTMNAIAYNPGKGYQDPFGGIEDIRQGIIRGVGEPGLRFKEDALRMLRCLRFSAQLGFEIEKNTLNALCENKELIKNVSAERISAEFIKLITSEYSQRVILLRDTELAKYCLPQCYTELKKRGDEICSLLNKIKFKEGSLAIIYSKACDPLGALKALRLSNEIIDETMSLIKYYDFEIEENAYELRKLLSTLGSERFLKLISIKKAKGEKNIHKAEEFIARENPITRKDLVVKGKDIKELGFQGKNIGIVLEKLLDIIFKDPEKNKKDILMEEVKKWQHL